MAPRRSTSFLLGILLAALALFSAGCASVESDNLSERPWNAPKSWEHGVPGSLIERR